MAKKKTTKKKASGSRAAAGPTASFQGDRRSARRAAVDTFRGGGIKADRDGRVRFGNATSGRVNSFRVTSTGRGKNKRVTVASNG